MIRTVTRKGDIPVRAPFERKQNFHPPGFKPIGVVGEGGSLSRSAPLKFGSFDISPNEEAEDTGPNPFFGWGILDMNTQATIVDDFYKQHEITRPAAATSPLWPYTGKGYLRLFPPLPPFPNIILPPSPIVSINAWEAGPRPISGSEELYHDESASLLAKLNFLSSTVSGQDAEYDTYPSVPPVVEYVSAKSEENYIFETLWLDHKPYMLPIPVTSDILSKPMDWTNMLIKDSDVPIGSGKFGDVFKCRWVNLNPKYNSRTPPHVVVKIFKIYANFTIKQVGKLKKIIEREVLIWQGLRHTNILRFVGLSFQFGDLPAIVSLWMPNGTIRAYLIQNPTVDRVSVVRGISNGLHYLHSCDPKIVHGDMKADNVLVNQNGVPCLSDFGLSKMLEERDIWDTSATSAPGTARWMAPELLDGSQQSVTTMADVYALAMTFLEIFTLQVPFPEYRHDAAVVTAIHVRKEKPKRPNILQGPGMETIWNLMVRCWTENPYYRPQTDWVISVLSYQ